MSSIISYFGSSLSRAYSFLSENLMTILKERIIIILLPILLFLMFRVQSVSSFRTNSFSGSLKKLKLNLTRLFSSYNPIQSIYDTLAPLSNGDIANIVADPRSTDAVQKCLKVMENLRLEDIGLNQNVLNQVTESVCMNIFSCDKFHLAVFIIPNGQSLPLHDHPKVSVNIIQS